jgi:hypothetical protein
MRTAIPALAAVLALSMLSRAATAETTTVYTDPQYGFTLSYPVKAAVETDAQENGQLDVIPVAAIVVSPDLAAFKGTNLGDASVSVGVSEDATIVAACSAAKAAQGEKPAGTVTLGSVKFARFTFEDAAMGNRYASTLYRAVDGGACYEIAEFVHWAAIENFPAGAVKEFDRAKVDAELRAITRSFALKRK